MLGCLTLVFNVMKSGLLEVNAIWDARPLSQSTLYISTQNCNFVLKQVFRQRHVMVNENPRNYLRSLTAILIIKSFTIQIQPDWRMQDSSTIGLDFEIYPPMGKKPPCYLRLTQLWRIPHFSLRLVRCE